MSADLKWDFGPPTMECSGCLKMATDFLFFHDEPKERFCAVCVRRAFKFGLAAANGAEAEGAPIKKV